MNTIIDLKPYLIAYLERKGIEVKAGQIIHCFSPAHTDNKASCQVWETRFQCYGCGIKGDILDAAAIIEGIAEEDKKAQIRAVRAALGMTDHSQLLRPLDRKKRSKFTPVAEALESIKDYLVAQAEASREAMITFLTDIRKHTRETAERLIDKGGLLYWPGREVALKHGIPCRTINSAGLMSKVWLQAGIVVPLRIGFTLHYLLDGETKKMRSSGGRAFNPGSITGDRLVITEGEFDAVACRAVDIPAVCAGGRNGVGKTEVEANIDSLRGFKEIIILFDNDSGKITKDGKQKEKDTRKAALNTARAITDFIDAEIRITFPPVAGADPDDMVRSGKIKELKACLETGELFIDQNKRIIEETREKAACQELPFALPVTYEELAECEDAGLLFELGSNSPGSFLLARAFSGIIIFVKNEKEYYFFNGNRYERLVDIYSITYLILIKVICLYWSKNNERGDKSQFAKIVRKIGYTKWKKDTLLETSCKKGIFNSSVLWDNPATRETLTLADKVLDFSGAKLIVRRGTPGEYRRHYLPWKAEEILKAGFPSAFIKFMNSIFPDPPTFEMAIYYNSLLLSGNPYYRKFGIAWGPPRSGKSTWIEIIEKMLPGLSVQINSDVIAPRKQAYSSGQNPTPEIAKMEGKRIVFATETDQGCRIAGNEVKLLTGGDTLTARELYQNPKEFQPTHQLCLITNFLPHLNCGDTALIDRIVILPFEAQFLENDKRTKPREKLVQEIIVEAPAVLNYLIDIYIHFRDRLRGVLPVSPKSMAYKEGYIKDEDDVGRFVTECCQIKIREDFYELTEDIARAYRDFFDMEEREMTTKKIISLLNRRFIEIDTGRKLIDGKRQRVLFNIRLNEGARCHY